MKLLDQIQEDFLTQCKLRNLRIEPPFARLYLHVLARDSCDGIDFLQLSTCRVERFIEGALRKYVTPHQPSVCCLQLLHCFAQAQEIKLDFVQQKYESSFKQKLQRLIDDILQYPETSSTEQIDQMFVKMQIFIVASYSLGCPKNHVLLKTTRQSLNSVIGRGDLQNYVLKKKYHRLEYLQRLSATVCGILVYNNYGPEGEKENMRNIVDDLEMAKTNTKGALVAALQRALECKQKGYKAMEAALFISVNETVVQFQCPVVLVREINAFIVLFTVHERYLRELMTAYERTEYLIGVGKQKLLCVMEKISEVLKCRVAIESELIFPHFVYLSEVWKSLVLYLNHLAELNRIKDQFDAFVTPALEAHYLQAVKGVHEECAKIREQPLRVCPFETLIADTSKKVVKGDLQQIPSEYIKDTCTLTIALTQGLLLPAKLQKKLCENLQIKFGFANIEYAKYAECHFEVFLQMLRNNIYSSMDMLMLLDLAQALVQQDFEETTRAAKSAKPSCKTQTELLPNDLSHPNRINVTWNKWDFHRETIRLANIRRRQTRTSQTSLSYGQRDSQQQTYNARSHK